ALHTVGVKEHLCHVQCGEHASMPGVMLVEARAQGACSLALEMLESKPADGTRYCVVGSGKLRVRQPVLPGDQLVLEAKFLSSKRQIWKFECKATVDGKAVCSTEIICAERKI
ncbi:3-hydroxyacyl-[acyl-carrier-protein] dehydratase FabZ, partial [Pseudomonas syringae]